jgi:UDP-glucose 4-epimerase
MKPVHEPPRPGDALHSLADLSRCRERLGFEPIVALAEGLRRSRLFYSNGVAF